eukprot:NODE_93_length_21581_cov_0.291919.p12 type:complete len:128 gc:universal NODE_93_length_21581_cov_0.291919:15270-14887(-)
MVFILSLALASIASCSSKGTFEIESLDFDDVIKPNVPASVVAAGNFHKQITAGTIKVSVKYRGFGVAEKNEDICTFLPCPIYGPNIAKKEFNLPGIAPGGDYSIKLEAKDQDGELVFCFAGGFKFVK